MRPLADHSPVLKRLTTILARSNLAAQAETQELLASLEEQARQSRRLAERAQVALTVVRLTLRVLVTANTVALALPSVLPTWRRHYLAHPLPYGVGLRLGAGRI